MIKVKVTYKARGLTKAASAEVMSGGESLAGLVQELAKGLQFDSPGACGRRRCALCSRGIKEVSRMVASANGAHVCDDCVEEAAKIIAEDLAESSSKGQDQGDPA